ncbi:saccharopine dehydrogenase NADP-binding domain-containing protein [Idiomarina sp.]|uniref:saccharopine dehydrogenase family protein n=1 Tax=Idiomarina sp. TaxID=1874361 RepID=UPI00258268AE|nr:saccharopine dehydrogenase NADP-binding domain-containing protein [Idiomarina sp.]
MALRWLIYGANGYSGKLIAHKAVARGYHPVLAGRNATEIEHFAGALQLQHRVFSLSDPSQVKQQLIDIDLVINCAGPFSKTAAPLIQACISTATHYLDITGEIDVFEYAHSQSEAAKKAGIVLCPGVGFDVIPTDCLAARLYAQMPDATHLALGFDSASRMSRGTAKTSIERLGHGGAARIDGIVSSVPLAWKERRIDFGNGVKSAMTIPWGDVATAFYTTSIPNIEVYIPAPPKLIKRLRLVNWFRWIFKSRWIQKQLKAKVDQRDSSGPDENARKANPTYIWGEVKNKRGDTKSMRFKIKNGYTVTAEGGVEVALYILQHDALPGGYYTPSRLCGAKLLDSFIEH